MRIFIIISALAIIGIVYGLCEWSFARGVKYERQLEAALWDGFFMDAMGYRNAHPDKSKIENRLSGSDRNSKMP